MDLLILFVILVFASWFLWPRKPQKALFNKDMPPQEMIGLWSTLVTMTTGVVLLTTWESKNEATITVITELDDEKKELFEKSVEELKEKLPEKIEITVKYATN